jgi:hypothetical protein
MDHLACGSGDRRWHHILEVGTDFKTADEHAISPNPTKGSCHIKGRLSLPLHTEGTRVFCRTSPTSAGSDLPDGLRELADHIQEMDASILPPCIYFLVSRGEVVYVGQTIDLRARISHHRRDKLFDRIPFLPTPVEELDQAESQLVGFLKPKYNFHLDWKITYQDAKAEAKRSKPASSTNP